MGQREAARRITAVPRRDPSYCAPSLPEKVEVGTVWLISSPYVSVDIYAHWSEIDLGQFVLLVQEITNWIKAELTTTAASCLLRSDDTR
jgi:hypothetical protein